MTIERISRAPGGGAADPAARRARLLPMLRARRASQHGSPAPDVLCLAPQGAFRARETALRLPPDSAVLAMTGLHLEGKSNDLV